MGKTTEIAHSYCAGLRTRYKYKMWDNPQIYNYRLNLYKKMGDIKHNRAGVETKSSENESSSDSPILKEILEN